MRPLVDEPYCWNHCPRVAPNREAARKLGGKNRRTAPGRPPLEISIRSVDAIRGQVEALLEATWQQENSHRRSLALGSLLGLALKVQELSRYEPPAWINELQLR
jgi:hypothetical protein